MAMTETGQFGRHNSTVSSKAWTQVDCVPANGCRSTQNGPTPASSAARSHRLRSVSRTVTFSDHSQRFGRRPKKTSDIRPPKPNRAPDAGSGTPVIVSVMSVVTMMSVLKMSLALLSWNWMPAIGLWPVSAERVPTEPAKRLAARSQAPAWKRVQGPYCARLAFRRAPFFGFPSRPALPAGLAGSVETYGPSPSTAHFRSAWIFALAARGSLCFLP